MSDDLRTLLDAMQARCDAATDGPWSATHGPHELPRIWSDAPRYEDAEFIAKCAMQDDLPDAEFIAAARQDLPRLVAAVRAVLDRACMEQDDAESAMTYAAQINDGLTLASQQARKQAWADAARVITTALLGGDDE